MSEERPEPLEMTDAGRYDFIECDCTAVKWLGHGWLVEVDGGKDFYAPDLGVAIGKAAAHLKEANRDF